MDVLIRYFGLCLFLFSLFLGLQCGLPAPPHPVPSLKASSSCLSLGRLRVQSASTQGLILALPRIELLENMEVQLWKYAAHSKPLLLKSWKDAIVEAQFIDASWKPNIHTTYLLKHRDSCKQEWRLEVLLKFRPKCHFSLWAPEIQVIGHVVDIQWPATALDKVKAFQLQRRVLPGQKYRILVRSWLKSDGPFIDAEVQWDHIYAYRLVEIQFFKTSEGLAPWYCAPGPDVYAPVRSILGQRF